MKHLSALAMALGLAVALPASADVVTLTFEGIGNNNPIGNFYSGVGVSFSANALALVDSDVAGTAGGNFANEPSPSTALFWLNDTSGQGTTVTVANGFTNGFSFYYSSSTAGNIVVFDDVDGKGEILGTIIFAAQAFENCKGDPEGSFCNWTPAGVPFSGVAKSVNFAGAVNFVAIDNMTFGSAVPGNGNGNGTVPEPASLALVGLALVGVGATRRWRKPA